MTQTRGSKRSSNLSEYARKRLKPATEPVATISEPAEFSTSPPPSRTSSPGPAWNSEYEEEIEDVEIETVDELDLLGQQLQTHFTRTLQEALKRQEQEQLAHTRPARYKKINSTNRTTLNSRQSKIKKQTADLRAKGYGDIRAFLKPRMEDSITPQEQDPTIEIQINDDDELEIEIETDIKIAIPRAPTEVEENAILAGVQGSPNLDSSDDVEDSPEAEAAAGWSEMSWCDDLGAEEVASDSGDLETPNETATSDAERGQESMILQGCSSNKNEYSSAQPQISSEIVDAPPQPAPTAPMVAPRPAPTIAIPDIVSIPMPALFRPPAKDSPAVVKAMSTMDVDAKRKDLHPKVRGRLMAMLAFLRYYTKLEMEMNWTEASNLAAVGAGKGKELGRQLRQWTRAYLEDSNNLPMVHYGKANKALIEDEEIRQDVQLHLQSLGKYFKALDIVDYSAQPEVMKRWGRDKPISERTARNWLHAMEYRYSKEKKKGQYVDGHERSDVVKYRQDVFLAKWLELEDRMMGFGKEGEIVFQPDPTLYRIVPITHDESTFYANDQRKTCWAHLSEGPVPIPEGDGTSLMVSDFCSPDLPGGWLRSKDGYSLLFLHRVFIAQRMPIYRSREARLFFKAGKNRDGYFSSEDILKTTRNAIDLFETHFPPESGVRALFLFDNATTHQKRAANALSARKMPKSTRRWPPNGPKMRDGTYPNGTPQSLYFADDHPDPEKAGLFKGMEVILHERGLWPSGGLRAECEGFKCADPHRKFDCCARRLLYNQSDFINQKSLLQELVESRGHHFLFYPKFHCELNFIEMCWGRAKYAYRTYGAPQNEAQQEERVRQALASVSHLSIVRFANRSVRFMSAYRQGLSGSQAAWANKKYHSHRTLPPELVAEIKEKSS